MCIQNKIMAKRLENFVPENRVASFVPFCLRLIAPVEKYAPYLAICLKQVVHPVPVTSANHFTGDFELFAHVNVHHDESLPRSPLSLAYLECLIWP